MAAIPQRPRSSLLRLCPWLRTTHGTHSHPANVLRCVRQQTQYDCRTPTRYFSISVSPWYPRIKGRKAFEVVKEKLVTKNQTAFENLLKAAEAVPEADEHFLKELGHHATVIEYLKMALSRLRPILQYSAQHPEAQFLKAYAPPGSSIDLARDATIYLFISAQGWTNIAVEASKERSQDLNPEVFEAAHKFSETVSTILTYLEGQLPESMGWLDVGTAILAATRSAWRPMRKAVDDIRPG